MKLVDKLPSGPPWHCEMVKLPAGKDGVEPEAELWVRDVNECLAELFGNPTFQANISYKPIKVFKDPEMTERVYGEAWTADWWWNTQVS